MAGYRRALLSLSALVATVGATLSLPSTAQAASWRSDACFSYACGSITATVLTIGGSSQTIKYNASVKDTICSSGSDARILIRVWYSDGTSTYGSAIVYDNNACDASPAQQNGLTFTGTAGKSISYFRAVVRDSNHTAGDLGGIATF